MSNELASEGTRLLAKVLDNILMTIIGGIYLVILLIGAASGGSDVSSILLVLGFLVLTPIAFGWFAYNIYLVNKYGQTFGKRIMKIKMVRTDGSPLNTIRWVCLRTWIPSALSGMTFGLFGLIDVLCIFGVKKTCLHDMISDTKVINCTNELKTLPESEA